jgi:hypothetical protein
MLKKLHDFVIYGGYHATLMVQSVEGEFQKLKAVASNTHDFGMHALTLEGCGFFSNWQGDPLGILQAAIKVHRFHCIFIVLGFNDHENDESAMKSKMHEYNSVHTNVCFVRPNDGWNRNEIVNSILDRGFESMTLPWPKSQAWSWATPGGFRKGDKCHLSSCAFPEFAHACANSFLERSGGGSCLLLCDSSFTAHDYVWQD